MNPSKAAAWIAVALLFFLFTSIGSILAIHLQVIPKVADSPLLRTHMLCASFGMLGASIAAVRKLYKSLITESTLRALGEPHLPLRWDVGWIIYYLTRPVLGGVLGALSFTLSYVGFQVLTGPVNVELSRHGRYLLFGVAVLCGFSVSHALDRMNAVAKDLLTSIKSVEK